ncbi:MAG: hypothetical protein IT461_00540 [Planctomycetes bacterium]|jgi:hypothetical protein|nr:hypothetical protein [Planctomycetota bacterium]
MQDKEGSKAMSIYIVICFLLAGAAGVGFKLKINERDELSSEYSRLYTLNQKVGQELSPNVADYWNKVENGTLKPVTAETKDSTPSSLIGLAEKHGLRDTQGADDQFDIQSTPTPTDKRSYMEYKIEVKLKNVMMGQWERFITEAERDLGIYKYSWITDLRIDRVDQRYEKIGEMSGPGNDSSLWNVSMTIRWFGPAKQTATTRKPT